MGKKPVEQKSLESVVQNLEELVKILNAELKKKKKTTDILVKKTFKTIKPDIKKKKERTKSIFDPLTTFFFPTEKNDEFLYPTLASKNPKTYKDFERILRKDKLTSVQKKRLDQIIATKTK